MNSAPVNLLDLVRDLPKRPRGRACAVLTKEIAGQKAWAAELASQTQAQHLDLLDLLASDVALGEKVGSFSPASLFDFLAARGAAGKVLIVTGLEVVFATWADDATALRQFASRLELWEKKTPFLFVLQREPTLEKYAFTRYPQYCFVVDQTHTIAFT